MDRLTSGQFHLQDRIIVGDAQAGVGYRIGDADVSLSYMRREATAEDFRFFGLSSIDVLRSHA